MAFNEAGIAILICGAAAGLEALLSGPRPFAFLRSLRQPAWSLPVSAWIAVGIAFYAIMAIILARLLSIGRAAVWGLTFIIVVLLADAIWNFLFFRLRRFDLAYYYLFPYSLIVIGAAIATYSSDPASVIPLALYILFLPYDVVWVSALRRLNPPFEGPERQARFDTERD
jgi:tryptophan-rich sensory protein